MQHINRTCKEKRVRRVMIFVITSLFLTGCGLSPEWVSRDCFNQGCNHECHE